MHNSSQKEQKSSRSFFLRIHNEYSNFLYVLRFFLRGPFGSVNEMQKTVTNFLCLSEVKYVMFFFLRLHIFFAHKTAQKS